MRRRLDLLFAVLAIALIAAYYLMGEGGATTEYQLWVGRSFVEVRWQQPDSPPTNFDNRTD